MKFPLSLITSMAGYLARNKLAGRQRFPLVMMLEPLHQCNFSCQGCGRIREYRATMDAMLTVEQCVAAVDECGAPEVSICGGEPLIYPEIGPLCEAILARGKHIHLCTNGMLLEKRLARLRFHPHLFMNVHLDGLAQTHDQCVEHPGAFDAAIAGIKAAKAAGFRVYTNTTVYQGTDMHEVEQLFELLASLGVDGFLLSPGYSYATVEDPSLFLTRAQIHEKFRTVSHLARRFPLVNSPIYLEFLQGKRETMPCTAWGCPTYTPSGWRSPCYLLADQHYATFAELLAGTHWEHYGKGKEPRCENCMVHSGYEITAALGIGGRRGDLWKQIRSQF